MDKNAVLKKVCDNFKEAEVEDEFYEEGEISPGSVLVCNHPSLGLYGDDGVGQYFFMDLGIAADNTEYFVGMITLDDDITGGDIDGLREAICTLNYFIPYGSFVLSPENEISYKYTAIMAADMKQDAAEAYVDLILSHVLEAFRRHIGLLMQVVRGEITAEDIAQMK